MPTTIPYGCLKHSPYAPAGVTGAVPGSLSTAGSTWIIFCTPRSVQQGRISKLNTASTSDAQNAGGEKNKLASEYGLVSVTARQRRVLRRL